MSLPAALAARLAKRGLLKNAAPKREEREVEEEEEVIAEDYDDGVKTSTVEPVYDSKVYPTVMGCPQKANAYHTCSLYCIRNYSDVPKEPSRAIKRKFDRILKDYPLDAVWEKVYEPGLKTFYFWNTETDQVSWWPPSHPKFKISMSAEKLRKMLLKGDKTKKDEEEESQSEESNSDDHDEDDSDDDSDDASTSEEEKKVAKVERKTPVPYQRRKPDMTHRPLDPMDPAAYSNIPRGKWSDGLNEAQKG